MGGQLLPLFDLELWGWGGSCFLCLIWSSGGGGQLLPLFDLELWGWGGSCFLCLIWSSGGGGAVASSV